MTNVTTLTRACAWSVAGTLCDNCHKAWLALTVTAHTLPPRGVADHPHPTGRGEGGRRARSPQPAPYASTADM